MSKKAQLMLKRAADTVISSFLLIVLTPVFVVTALAIKLTSRGPCSSFRKGPGSMRRSLEFISSVLCGLDQRSW